MGVTSIPDCIIPSPESGHPTTVRARDCAVRHRIKAFDLFLLSAWCGLASGLLEVGARVICRAIDPTQRLYMVSRHFLWLGPLSSLLFFLGIGLVLSVAVKVSPRAAGWLGPRVICALGIMPALLAAGPRIYPEAWALFGFGMGVQLVPILERRHSALRRKLVWTFPVMLGLVVLLATYVFLGDRLEQWREAGRPLPPASSPNVLLIVLDTVRADRLSLYGYERSTTPMLERLAQRGIRFDEARATAPWTLPSHASMFTGRWPHEVGEKWVTPLRVSFPTLAEYLGEHGYATAGFVANVVYCSQETGLARGFTHYEDYPLEKLAPLRTSGLVEYIAGTIYQMIPALEIRSLRPLQISMHHWFGFGGRKTGASVRRAFLRWLFARPETGRPFFAFLNLCDAHQEYKLPPGAEPRFIRYLVTADEIKQVYERWPFIDKMELPPPYLDFARDSYDECLAYLDDQLGLLFSALHNRGVLDHTLVVVTSDHGEGLGEHNLFDHGESLYRTEIRAPLVIAPPSGLDRPSVVRETVSLRDLPATIVDMLGFGAGSPFPGKSLARFWRDSPSGNVDANGDADPVVSELIAPNPAWPNRGRSPAARGPLISLASGKFVYIRNERDGSEQLFDERGDPAELSDQSRAESMQPLLDDFRHRLDKLRRESARSFR
ncbi:MAG: sulfatase-like hydrolase/transferase [Isosphaeraceae bacterium]